MSKEAELLEHVAKALVDDPSGVVVKEEQDGDFLKLHLQVAEADVGKVIGRGGRIAARAIVRGRGDVRLRLVFRLRAT